MDEQDARIAAVFRDAADGAPPPGFDAGDVVAVSRRITRRRRAAVAGAALAVLAVVGVGVTAGFGRSAGSETTTASAVGANDAAAPQAPAPEAARAAAPDAGAAAGSGVGSAAGGGVGSDAAAAEPAPVAGAAVPPVGAPLGPGTTECANRQDPALRALLEQVLPEVAGAPEAMTTQECRPGGERDLALEVRDGAVTGLLSVTSLPPGSIPKLVDGARTAPTASGGTLIVTSRSDRAGDPAPFGSRLDAVVAGLAPRL
jgi:hypothetical protein